VIADVSPIRIARGGGGNTRNLLAHRRPGQSGGQSHRNPDGVGIGVFGTDAQPTVDKQPLAAWQDPMFASEARDLRGTTFLAHVRYASTGGHTLANTHPFLQQGRIFAHNGVVQGVEDLDSRLTQLGANGLVQGQTDSERIFALITAETIRHGGDVADGIISALSWIAEQLPVYALNLLLITATDMWALRYPATHQLYVLARPAGGTGDGQSSLEHRSHRIRARAPHLADKPSVIIASERMDDDPGWQLLAPGKLLHVDRTLTISGSAPLPATPRHLLTLAELDEVSAASQHPTPSEAVGRS
jgi:predicted glutamine amidotransferase